MSTRDRDLAVEEFDRFADSIRHMVRRAVPRMDEAMIDDIMQEARLGYAVRRNADVLNPRALAFKIAKHKALDALMDAMRRVTEQDNVEQVQADVDLGCRMEAKQVVGILLA